MSDISDNSDHEENALDEEEKQLKEALRFTSYETLMKLKKEDGQLSSLSKKIKKHRDLAKKKDSNDKKHKKNRPQERSAKIPVSRFQTVVSSSKITGRDPRFDTISGKLNSDLFQKSYGFLVDQKKEEVKILQSEIKKKLKKKNTEEEVEKLRQALSRDKDELARFNKNTLVKSVKSEFKKKVQDNVEKGAKPFFIKKSDLKNKVMEKQFEDLDKRGRLKKKLEEKKLKESKKSYIELKKIERNSFK